MIPIIRLIPQGTTVKKVQRLEILTIADKQPVWLHDLCLEVLTVPGNELRLSWTKAFPLSILLLSRIWYISSSYNFLGRELNPLPPQRRSEAHRVTPQTQVKLKYSWRNNVAEVIICDSNSFILRSILASDCTIEIKNSIRFVISWKKDVETI